MAKKTRGLGKGLQALIPNNSKGEEDKALEVVSNIPLYQIVPNPHQPRKEFDVEKLKELAESIQEHGIIQPVIVRRKGENFELIAGERRFRAAQHIKLESVPAVIKIVEDDNRLAEIALIENIQREELNPIDEALAYKKLLTEFKLTQEELSKRVGKSRPFIANMTRILGLPPKIQHMISKGELSAGHGRALLSIEDRTLQVVVAEKVARNQLSVRQTEELVKSLNNDQAPGSNNLHKAINPNPIIFQTEDKLKKLLGTKVKIKDSGGKGKIEIEYYNDEDFNRILDLVLPGEEF